MRIGLLSDTHISEVTEALPLQLIEAFQGVDLILHAGDIFISEVLDKLERIAPVLAASGDDDFGAVLRDKRVKSTHILAFEGKTLWLVHDSQQYYQFKSRRTSNIIKQSDAPDILVFGHTHYSILEHHNGILCINPGSPMDSHPKLGTIAILAIESNKAPQANIIQLRA